MEIYSDPLRQLRQKTERMNHLERILNHLYDRQKSIECSVHDLELADNKEQADVERLEGKTFAAFFYGLIGQKDDRLSKERTEALASRAKLETAERELLALGREIADYEAELESLSGCDVQYASLLEEKLEQIRSSAHPNAAVLLRLMNEITAAEHRMKEIDEALEAGKKAKKAARNVIDELDSAEDWGAFDAFGGGTVAGVMKHSHLDTAQERIWTMRKNLEKFRTELSDVNIHADLQVNVDGFTKFADVFLDNFFVDFDVLDRIKNSRSQVRHVMEQIERTMRQLKDSRKQTEKALQQLRQKYEDVAVESQL